MEKYTPERSSVSSATLLIGIFDDSLTALVQEFLHVATASKPEFSICCAVVVMTAFIFVLLYFYLSSLQMTTSVTLYWTYSSDY